MKHVILVIVCLAGSQMLAPTVSLADVLKCKIDSYREDIFITTAPHTDQNDGQYARIGISPGIGDRAIVFADRMGAVAFPLKKDLPACYCHTLSKLFRLRSNLDIQLGRVAGGWQWRAADRRCALRCAGHGLASNVHGFAHFWERSNANQAQSDLAERPRASANNSAPPQSFRATAMRSRASSSKSVQWPS